MTQAISEELRVFDGDKLYWAGSYNANIVSVSWLSELESRTSPNFTPSESGNGNQIASVFSTSGDWLQAISNSQETTHWANITLSNVPSNINLNIFLIIIIN